MFRLEAPYPATKTTTALPNPQFSDQESLKKTVSRKLAMDGTRYTYVKTSGGRRKLRWSFRLSRPKGLELRAFIYCYFAQTIRIVDHNDRMWVGNFTSNPFEFTTDSKASPAIRPMPRGELQSIDIEFEGEEVI